MSRLSGQFRYSAWDPILLLAQILTIQFIFYSSLGFWIFASDLLTGASRTLDHVFLYEALHINDFHGRLIIGAFVVNALVCSLGLWYFVQRTRLCLDFSSTAHFVHLLVCWCFNSAFPHSLCWWLLNIVCLAIMCVCGEFLCMRTELKAIPLSLGPKADL